MDRLNHCKIVKKALTDYISYFKQGGVTTLRPLFNDEQQTYLVLNIGWRNKRYIHNTIIHIDLIDQQIWIQKDDTEEGIATALVFAGVPKSQIVLGFREPELRPYTDFAVGQPTPTQQEQTV